MSTASDNGTTDTAYAYVAGGSVAETNGTFGPIFVPNILVYNYVTDVDISIKSGILAKLQLHVAGEHQGLMAGQPPST